MYFVEGSVERALAAARAHKDFVLGFICQENVLAAHPEESPSFLYCTPGVRIGTAPIDIGMFITSSDDQFYTDSQGDGKGQTYRTPETVIVRSLALQSLLLVQRVNISPSIQSSGCDVAIVGRGICSAEVPCRQVT